MVNQRGQRSLPTGYRHRPPAVNVWVRVSGSSDLSRTESIQSAASPQRHELLPSANHRAARSPSASLHHQQNRSLRSDRVEQVTDVRPDPVDPVEPAAYLFRSLEADPAARGRDARLAAAG